MPTNTNVTNLKINTLTEAQYDTAVQGGVIGANELSVITDLDDSIQVSTMPTASASEEGKIYQFIGTTGTYTNGYFYKCVSDGGNPATYSWEQVNVQPTPSGLPSQTGNAGKFLKTDGTDASWGDALVNTATGNNSITIGGIATTNAGAVNIGKDSSTAANSTTVVGSFSSASGQKAITIGSNSMASGTKGISIGFKTRAGANGSIQIGNYNDADTINSDANTFKVGNANGNYEMMSADGTIPTARLTKVNTTITLASANWSSNSQTVSVTGITATGIVFVSPDPTDQSAYTSAGIICSAQGSGTLSFTCDTTPSADIDVVVVML